VHIFSNRKLVFTGSQKLKYLAKNHWPMFVYLMFHLLNLCPLCCLFSKTQKCLSFGKKTWLFF